MRLLIRRFILLGLAVLFTIPVAATTSQTSQPRGTNAEAAVLADFQKRIEAYREMHSKLDKGAAELEETPNPEDIRAAQQTLAARIRAARKNARPGDIFTPDIRATFRRLMYPEFQGAEGRQTKSEIKEDAPKDVPLKVNSAYPEGAPRPTVPANVLANLPQLPEDLEYRIVDKHLILLDVDANLIVDYIPNAIR